MPDGNDRDSVVIIPPMPVIVGSPRSGTTLLRFMLDAHPELAIPPETGFAPVVAGLDDDVAQLPARFVDALVDFPPEAPAWEDFGLSADELRARALEIRPFTVAEGVRLFYCLYAERCGKSRWGDKTPSYVHHMRVIATLLPEARFVHVVRDGRDAAVSLRQQWFSPGWDIERQAEYWRDNIDAASAQSPGAARLLEVRFEDLVSDPEPELRRICAFIDLDFHSDMLAYLGRVPFRLSEHRARHRSDGTLLISRQERLAQQAHTLRPLDPAKVGAWRTGLSTDEVLRFEAIAGPQLARHGYPLVTRPRSH